MNKIRIGLGLISHRIYAGKLNKAGSSWLSKSDVTSDFWGTLIDYAKNVDDDFTITSSNGETHRVHIALEGEG